MMNQLITMEEVTNQDYPIRLQHLSSPSTSIEELDIRDFLANIKVNLVRQNIRSSFYYLRSRFETDQSSIRPYIEIKSGTSSIEELGEDITRIVSEEEIILEMLEQDFVVKMPPKKKYKIQVIVRSIKKGKPRIVEPDEFLIID